MAREGPPPEEPYDSAERSVEERRRLVKEAMDRFFAPDQAMGDATRQRTTGRAPADAGRDLVSTSRGVRPQRSTEELGSGPAREVPETPGRDAWSARDQAGPPGAGQGTPEGHTAERPAAEEYGQLGTPAAAMSPTTAHAADADDAARVPDAHGAVAAHGHAEEHEEEALGPIDWRAWGAAALGVGAAALIAILFYVASLGR